MLITGLAPTIAWLFIGRTLSGMAGAAYPTVNAYIADISPPEKRAANFGLVGAAFGLGFILGPALGGFVGEHFGLRAPFFVAAGLAFANALFGLVVLKESLPPERRRKFEWWRANPLGSLKALARFPAADRCCSAVLVLMQFAHDSLPSTWTYYTMLKFGWGPGDVAWSLVAVGVLTALSFAVLPRLAGAAHRRDARRLSGICSAAPWPMPAMPSPPSAWMFYAWMIVFALGRRGRPGAERHHVPQVPANEQGELQGAVASITSLTSIVAMWAMPSLFAWFTGAGAPVYFPGAAFLAAALCELGALMLFARSRKAGRA